MKATQVQDILKIADIRENPAALRPVDVKGEGYQQLKRSIQAQGLIYPITVRAAADAPGKYVITDGAHRFTACRELGYDDISVIIETIDDMQVYERQIVANLARVATKPAEYAKQIKRMQMLNPLLTAGELASKLGMTTTTLQAWLRVSDLKPEYIALMNEGKVGITNAQTLARLPAEEQENWIERAMTLNAGEFKEAVEVRIREIAKAKSAGRDPNAARVFEPSPKLRKLSDISGALNDTAQISAIADSASTVTEAVTNALRWVVSLDAATVSALRANFEKDEAERKAVRAKERADRLQKQADEAKAEAAKIKG